MKSTTDEVIARLFVFFRVCCESETLIRFLIEFQSAMASLSRNKRIEWKEKTQSVKQQQQQQQQQQTVPITPFFAHQK